MLLSSLTRKEKLKFLDLAIHIAAVDGTPDIQEQRLLNVMIAEVGDDIVKEYHFSQGDNLEVTLKYFENCQKDTKRIVYMNLFKISVINQAYTTEEHFLLEKIRERLGISESKKKAIIQILYDERDLRAKALQLVKGK